MKTWLHIFKIQLYLRYPKKTVSIIFICTILFAILTIYMNENPFNLLFSQEVINVISTKLSLAYLSLLSLTGLMSYLSYNGFLEDTPIFMSMITKKINLFYIVLAKVFASLIYSIFPILVSIIINYYFTKLSISVFTMLIISQFMLFYVIYFLTYSLCNSKNFGLILAYILVISSIISVLFDAKILFMIIFPIFIISSIFFYLHINSILLNSLFDTKNIFDNLSSIIDKLIYSIINSKSCFISHCSNNFQFKAMLYKDFYNFIFNFPQIIVLYLCLLPIPKTYIFISNVCLQISIYNFFRKITLEDRILLQFKLISYKNFFINKVLILNIFNFFYTILFYLIYRLAIYQFFINVLLIIIIVLLIEISLFLKRNKSSLPI